MENNNELSNNKNKTCIQDTAFVVNLWIERTDGEYLGFEAQADGLKNHYEYEDEDWDDVGIAYRGQVYGELSPKALAQCQDIGELVKMLEDESTLCDEMNDSILTDDTLFLQDVEELGSMDDIAKITIKACSCWAISSENEPFEDGRYTTERYYTQIYTYNCLTKTYTKAFEGENYDTLYAGELLVPDEDEAKEIAFEEAKMEVQYDFLISQDELLSYLGTDAHVTVPDKVTVIGEGAFDAVDNPARSNYDNVYNITSVTLPKGLKIIEDFAFSDSGIQDVYMPASVDVEYISPCAFPESEEIMIHEPERSYPAVELC